jgi:two-component system, cell cycle response regulator DivK
MTSTGLTILLAEDDPLNADMLSRRLSRRGHTVVIATNGLEALDGARRHRPDVILMDVSLPVLDGWEATRRLKADAATAAIPVVALTAHAMTLDRQASLAAGCDEFETKPIDLARLLEKLARLVPEGVSS